MPLSVSLLAASFLLIAPGCASDSEAPAADDVTGIKNSSIKDQKNTGNCWLYATLAWVESMNLAATGTGTPTDFSPAYLNYWQWYDQITQEDLSARAAESLSDGTTVAAGFVTNYGGSWGLAVEYIHRYGLMKLGAFVDNDAATSAAARLALRKALATDGSLGTAAARKDKAKVRAALDAAFRLTPEVSAALTAAFGPKGEDTFAKSPQKTSYDSAGIQILRSKDIPVALVRSVNGNAETKQGTLADAIGTNKPGLYPDFGFRVGNDAWSAVIVTSMYAPKDIAVLSKRLRRALNASAALPLAFRVDKGNKDERSGAFKGPMLPKDAANPTARPGIGAEHEVLITDYEVTNVPGFGTLRAGETATPAQMSAALDDAALVSFFRVKNSWGEEAQADVGQLGTRGYYDLYSDYLFTKVKADGDEVYGFVNVALPPGF